MDNSYENVKVIKFTLIRRTNIFPVPEKGNGANFSYF